MGMFADLHTQDIAEQQNQTAPAKPKPTRSRHSGHTSVIAAEMTEQGAGARAGSDTSQEAPTAVQETRPPARPGDRPLAAAADQSRDVAPGRPPDRRAIARKSFEVFQDQFDTIKWLALEDQLRGGKGNMSGMVREALDHFIAGQQRSTE